MSSPWHLFLLLQLLFGALYAGFQCTVRFLVYPQFKSVPPAGFPAYERTHQRRISFLAGPAFGGMAATQLGLWLNRPAGAQWWPVALTTVLLGVILGVTALLAVPEHRALTLCWREDSFHALLRADSYRTLAAVINAGIAVVVLI